MKCKNFEQEIVLYHSNELTEDRKSILEEHINKCTSCAQFSAQISKTLQYFNKSNKITDNIDVWPKVKEKLFLTKRKFFPKWVYVPAAALVIIGMIVANLFLPTEIRVETSDIEIVKELEFLVDYELWEDLETLEVVELTT